MEGLTLRKNKLLKALTRFDYMKKKFLYTYENREKLIPTQPDEEEPYIGYRDALIQRFEFSYDLIWKFLKLYLELKYKVSADSPRRVFQESLQQGIISLEENQTFLKMIEARNYTTHIYDEELIQDLARDIITYLETAKLVTKRLN